MWRGWHDARDVWRLARSSHAPIHGLHSSVLAPAPSHGNVPRQVPPLCVSVPTRPKARLYNKTAPCLSGFAVYYTRVHMHSEAATPGWASLMARAQPTTICKRAHGASSRCCATRAALPLPEGGAAATQLPPTRIASVHTLRAARPCALDHLQCSLPLATPSVSEGALVAAALAARSRWRRTKRPNEAATPTTAATGHPHSGQPESRCAAGTIGVVRRAYCGVWGGVGGGGLPQRAKQQTARRTTAWQVSVSDSVRARIVSCRWREHAAPEVEARSA